MRQTMIIVYPGVSRNSATSATSATSVTKEKREEASSNSKFKINKFKIKATPSINSKLINSKFKIKATPSINSKLGLLQKTIVFYLLLSSSIFLYLLSTYKAARL